MHLLLNCKLQTLQLHRSHDVEGTGINCEILTQGQIMYFLVNASPPKPLDVATLQVHRSDEVEGNWQHLM